ncbi:MAG: outer membrane lipoprotein-sorting protein [Nitrospinae bacterium]|nr:outer membrane lipoprotein-sorting protein [Nitrospinota bacterium]
MIIETRRWSRKLNLEGWYKDGTRALVTILAPPKEAGKVSLKIDGAMWNYLPNIGQAIRVHPSAMSQSWMGSDFSNDDLIRETSFVDDYSQTSEGIEDTASGKVYRLVLIPHSDASIVWGKVIYLITVKENLPIRQEFYDEHGALIRVLTFSDFKVMDGRLIPTVWIMKRSGREGQTTIVISEVTFDVNIPDRLFSIKEIER